MPYFSIIIPAYNRSSHIVPAIDSVIAQTFQDWELLIVDDASTDDTADVVRSFCNKDKRIALLQQPYNQERGAARNRGIEEANGTYICFLDSDDLFCDNHLATIFEHTRNASEDAMYFANSYLSVNGGEKAEKLVPRFTPRSPFSYLLVYTPNPARVCIHAGILQNLRFDASIPGLEDLDLWLRIACQFPLCHIEEYTSVYNLHDECYTIGDAQRYEKELTNFRYIFQKKELRGKLPFWGKRRLLSMCKFHLSQKAFLASEKKKAFALATGSFLLYPLGYNGKINKIVATTILYSLPIIGSFFKTARKLLK